MLLGTTPSRLARLSVVPGLDRRTLARWRAWWRSTFTDGPFAAVAMAAVAPPIDIAALPVSLLDRFAGDVTRAAHRLAALPRSADRRRIGDARFLTGAANPQRMRVAGPRRGRLASAR